MTPLETALALCTDLRAINDYKSSSPAVTRLLIEEASEKLGAINAYLFEVRQSLVVKNAPPCHPNTCEHECLGLGYCVRFAAATNTVAEAA